MTAEYIIPARSGLAVCAKEGQRVTVTDVEGGQVVDFFAETAQDAGEFLSPGVTMDCNESLRLRVGQRLYSNRYRAMFEIVHDDVGEHDLLHPCCRTEMYDFFYHNGAGHPNCLDNINRSLGRSHPLIRPVNLFMHTHVGPDGSLTVRPPLSRAGDRIVLRTLMDVRLGIAACSVSESDCNSGRCSPVRVEIAD